MSNLLNFNSTDQVQKKELNKLKHDLEEWREAILHGSRILTWEKAFYPAIIFAAVTVQFLFIWYTDLSELTLFSLTLLLIALVDYLYPILGKFVFKPEKWTGVQEKEFEVICVNIYNAKQCFYRFAISMIEAKEKKSTLFFLVVSAVLLVLAWIGSTIDNLLLSYLTTLFVLYYPGLCKIGVIAKVKEVLGGVLSANASAASTKTD